MNFQLYALLVFFTTYLLLLFNPARRSSLCLDLMAPLHVLRIRLSLTLDAAVPIEVTSTAPLGRNTSLVRAVRVGAGLR